MSYLSQLFRSEASKLPQHTQHIHARMMATMYLTNRFGTLVQRHKTMLARALANADKQISTTF